VIGRGLGTLSDVQYRFEWTDEERRLTFRFMCPPAVPLSTGHVLLNAPLFCPKTALRLIATRHGSDKPLSPPVSLQIVSQLTGTPELHAWAECRSDPQWLRLCGDNFSRVAGVWFEPPPPPTASSASAAAPKTTASTAAATASMATAATAASAVTAAPLEATTLASAPPSSSAAAPSTSPIPDTATELKCVVLNPCQLVCRLPSDSHSSMASGGRLWVVCDKRCSAPFTISSTTKFAIAL
jgi:hypothetical protein